MSSRVPFGSVEMGGKSRDRLLDSLSTLHREGLGFPDGTEGRESARKAGHLNSVPGSGRSPGEGNGKPTPVFLSGEFHGQRRLTGYIAHGITESDTAE